MSRCCGLRCSLLLLWLLRLRCCGLLDGCRLLLSERIEDVKKIDCSRLRRSLDWRRCRCLIARLSECPFAFAFASCYLAPSVRFEWRLRYLMLCDRCDGVRVIESRSTSVCFRLRRRLEGEGGIHSTEMRAVEDQSSSNRIEWNQAARWRGCSATDERCSDAIAGRELTRNSTAMGCEQKHEARRLTRQRNSRRE